MYLASPAYAKKKGSLQVQPSIEILVGDAAISTSLVHKNSSESDWTLLAVVKSAFSGDIELVGALAQNRNSKWRLGHKFSVRLPRTEFSSGVLSLEWTDIKISKNEKATGIRLVSKSGDRKGIHLFILVRLKLDNSEVDILKNVFSASVLEYRTLPASPDREYGEAGVLFERDLVILSSLTEGYFDLQLVPTDDFILKQHKLDVAESYFWHSGEYVLKK